MATSILRSAAMGDLLGSAPMESTSPVALEDQSLREAFARICPSVGRGLVSSFGKLDLQ